MCLTPDGICPSVPKYEAHLRKIQRGKYIPSGPGRSRKSDIPTHCLGGKDVLALIKFPLLSLVSDLLLWACDAKD